MEHGCAGGRAQAPWQFASVGGEQGDAETLSTVACAFTLATRYCMQCWRAQDLEEGGEYKR